jgi:hypothetical protein
MLVTLNIEAFVEYFGLSLRYGRYSYMYLTMNHLFGY